MTETCESNDDLSGTVASHYNKRESGSIAQRLDSRIFYLRNFNNWIKSMLISDGIYTLKRQGQDPRTMNVLDLGSGKGGDQQKWRKAGVKHVVFADIAEISIEHCKSRYGEIKARRNKEANHPWPLFTAEFHAADCTRLRLRDMYEDPHINFDLISCQFALHYAFESMSKARQMLLNAAENLRPGGLFIGTIPDAFELVRRARDAAMKSDSGQVKGFGNDIYSVSFEKPVTAKDLMNGNHFPLFGAKYHFTLEGVVNCPEFLVYFPLLEELALEQGLELHTCMPFADFFTKSIQRNDGRGLIGRMQALETFPPQAGVKPMGNTSYSYATVNEWIQAKIKNTGERPESVGTLSAEEWEAVSLYLIFMFVKKDRRKPQEEAKSTSETEPEEEEEVPVKRGKFDAPDDGEEGQS